MGSDADSRYIESELSQIGGHSAGVENCLVKGELVAESQSSKDGGDIRNVQTCLRPYHPERAQSCLILEANQGRAWLVLGREKCPNL